MGIHHDTHELSLAHAVTFGLTFHLRTLPAHGMFAASRGVKVSASVCCHFDAISLHFDVFLGWSIHARRYWTTRSAAVGSSGNARSLLS